MIHNVVDFRGVQAKDVMMPLAEVRTLSAQTDIAAMLTASRETGLERWPLRGEDGKIAGLVQVFDVALDGRTRGPVEPFQRRIVTVTEHEPAYTVLRKLRAARITVAVVNGADGTQVGVVFWEDLIRRLVTVAGEKAGGQ